MTRGIVFFILSWILSSCSYQLRSDEMVGADEFVLDSYKIRKGKVSILEMEGIEMEELDESFFQEDEKLLSQKVELIGPLGGSTFFVDGKTHLYSLLSQAKVGSDVDFFQSYVLREDQILPIDFYKLIHQGDMEQNIVMRDGDKVYLAQKGASSVMVMGEVEKKRVIAIPSGFISLKEAIISAGGILPTADRSMIQIIRGKIARPKIYTVHFEHLNSLPNDSLLLMDGDVVYVGVRPITKWLRSIPSLNIVEKKHLR